MFGSIYPLANFTHPVARPGKCFLPKQVQNFFQHNKRRADRRGWCTKKREGTKAPGGRKEEEGKGDGEEKCRVYCSRASTSRLNVTHEPYT